MTSILPVNWLTFVSFSYDGMIMLYELKKSVLLASWMGQGATEGMLLNTKDRALISLFSILTGSKHLCRRLPLSQFYNICFVCTKNEHRYGS